MDEFHDGGVAKAGTHLWVPDCECGWVGEPTPLTSHALEQLRKHQQEVGYEG